ncbi:MAG TPA: hypothetical protein PLI01_00285 [Nitrospira sp.]|nr:hypothetical protein [Nitrospira sp.]HNA25196.1 hypothetical protein [Nitrospira sp.]HNI17538.1 hypothetical protein [Nitrospira sp.]
MEAYKPVVQQDFSGGWNLRWALNAAQLLENESPYIVNMDYAARFALTKRRGVKIVGDRNTGMGSIPSLYTYKKYDGTEILIRSRDTILEKLAAGVWTSFDTGFTASQLFDFVTANNIVIYGNAVEAMKSYDGSSVTSYGSNPKGNIMEVGYLKLFVAGVTANPNRLYYSVTDDYVNFSGGGSGSTDFQAKIVSVRCFFTRDGAESVQVFLANGDIFDVGFDSGGIYKKKVRINCGAVTHRSTKQIENYNFVIDVFKDIRAVGYEESFADLRASERSSPVSPYLLQSDLSLASAIYTRRDYILALKEQGALTNNAELVYSDEYKSWRRYIGHSITQFAVYGGNLCFASATDPNVYQYDSSTYNDDGVPIYARFDTKGFNFGDPIRSKHGRYVKIAGYISSGCEIGVSLIGDGKYNSPLSQKTISGDGPYVDKSYSLTWGSDQWGGVPWAGFAGYSSNIELRPFWVAVMCSDAKFDELRIMLENYQSDVDFVITYIKPNYVMDADDRIPADNQI